MKHARIFRPRLDRFDRFDRGNYTLWPGYYRLKGPAG